MNSTTTKIDTVTDEAYEQFKFRKRVKISEKRSRMVFSSSEESGDEVTKVNEVVSEVNEATGKRQQPGYVLRDLMVILRSDASERPGEETPVLRDDSDEDTDDEDSLIIHSDDPKQLSRLTLVNLLNVSNDCNILSIRARFDEENSELLKCSDQLTFSGAQSRSEKGRYAKRIC